MLPTRPLLKLRGFLFSVGMIVAALVLVAAVSGRSAQNSAPPKDRETPSPPSALNDQAALATPKQPEEPKGSSLEKTRSDAAELSALADQLRDELKKMNVNVLALDVIQKAEKVEKLARKIKGEAHGK